MNFQSFPEIRQFEVLIREGRRLLSAFQAVNGKDHFKIRNSGLAVPVTISMDEWFNKSEKLLYSVLPKTVINEDFAKAKNIFQNKKDGQIVQGDLREEISDITNQLVQVLAFLKWLVEFDDHVLSYRQKANYEFARLRAVTNFGGNEICPLLVGLENGQTNKTALLHLYCRIYLAAFGVIRLNEVQCFQVLVGVLRSMLELYTDLILIKNGLVDNGVEKFFMFDVVHHLNSARKLAIIDSELQIAQGEATVLRKFIENNIEKENDIARIWGRKAKPQHWSNLTMKERARRAGLLEMFRNVYYYGNQYVHSGFTKYPRSEDDAHFLCSYVYAFINEMLKEASDIICDEIDVEMKAEIKREIQDLYLFFDYFQVWKSWIGRNGQEVSIMKSTGE